MYSRSSKIKTLLQGPLLLLMAQSAAELNDCFSTEGYNSFNECPGYDNKQSDGEAPVMLCLWGHVEYPFIAIAPRSTLAGGVRTW